MLKNNIDLDGKTILVTGAAGFIGSNLVKRLLTDYPKSNIVGIDNMNDYYDVKIKEERLSALESNSQFKFIRGSISDKSLIFNIFAEYRPQIVVRK